MPYSFALLYAAEMGDTEAAAGIRRTLDDMLTPDGDRPGPGSLVSMAVTFMALTNSERAVAAGHRHAPCLDTGPELAHAPHPDVVVTEAREREGGVTCELVPGPDASAPVMLAFARLRPEADHVVRRDGVVADRVTTDERGRLEVVHDPTARARIDVVPAP